MLAAVEAIRRSFGKEPLFTREGGSIPIVHVFQTILGAPTILLGFGLQDENAHSPDEHFDLDNFRTGILTSAYFLEELSKIKLNTNGKG